MKSRWHRAHAGEQHSPVEMRFVDMFMTALGALVFLAMLLVFLLPRIESTKTEEQTQQKNETIAALNTRKEELEETIRDLTAQLRERQQPEPALPAGANREDKNIVKRWFGVLLLTQGCRPNQPALYVRFEGKLINFDTGEAVPEAEQFDASDVSKRTFLVGHRYFDIGGGQQKIGEDFEFRGMKDLSKNGLHLKLFYGVTRSFGPGTSYSIYAGLSDPRGQGDVECVINPVYLSSTRLISGETIALTRDRPYAWLRRVEIIDADGNTTFGKRPKDDEEFRRDIAEFSKKQSRILCDRKRICNTMDAHLAVLDPSTADPVAKFRPGDTFKDCASCPEMVVVSSGSFAMGASPNAKGRDPNEVPQHAVNFPKSFAVGRFAVTFDEWDACVAGGGCDG